MSRRAASPASSRGRPLSLLVLLAFAAAGLPAAAQPKIRFGALVKDLGDVRSDQPVEFDWEFHNEGTHPLRIVRMKTSCGCTMTVLENDVVEPGGQGAIRITFDPAGLEGSVRKTLAVTSDDPERPMTRLTLRANVIPVEIPREPGSHPPTTGQSLLMGACADCHAAPAAGKSGAELYRAVCAMCHGERAGGALAPSLRHKSYLDERSDRELHEGIAFGTANPKMPGFSSMMGGPLSDGQVRSLVELLREWGATETAAPGGG